MISVCVAVYRDHGAPNVAGLGASLAAALDGREGELVVALNGVDAHAVGVPADARTVDLKVNRGVAPGWNAAAKAARGEVLVFCNDDVELGPRALAGLADALASRTDAGVVGPVGSHWDLVRAEHRDWVKAEGRAPGELVECEVVSGFLFACRRETWEAVCGFEERYAPASWEEVDFCTSVRASGLRCYAVAGISCGHEWGVSRRQPPWARAHWDGRSERWRSIHRRNRRLFMSKWSQAPIATAGLDGSMSR